MSPWDDKGDWVHLPADAGFPPHYVIPSPKNPPRTPPMTSSEIIDRFSPDFGDEGRLIPKPKEGRMELTQEQKAIILNWRDELVPLVRNAVRVDEIYGDLAGDPEDVIVRQVDDLIDRLEGSR